MPDSFGTRSTLKLGGETYEVFRGAATVDRAVDGHQPVIAELVVILAVCLALYRYFRRVGWV